jgi:prepilin-type N-terminal cleavage/methylation domain-containing protein
MENTSQTIQTKRARPGEAGFSLIEVACALVIILVALLGVVFSFTYVVNYNAGNNARSQALAVLQAQVEQLRAAKFTRTITSSVAGSDLRGGTHTVDNVTTTAGLAFNVQYIVDNDPFTAGVQATESSTITLKEITVNVTLRSPSPGWQFAVPATAVLRRTRGN